MATSSASSFWASGMARGWSVFAMSTGTTPGCTSRGVTTMKMISRTSITSTIGVTLISELILLPSFLFAIAIPESPSNSTALVLLPWRRGILVVGGRWRSCRFVLLRQQSQLVYTGRADIIHHVHNHAVLGMSISPHKDALVRFAVQLVSHLLG